MASHQSGSQRVQSFATTEEDEDEESFQGSSCVIHDIGSDKKGYEMVYLRHRSNVVFDYVCLAAE